MRPLTDIHTARSVQVLYGEKAAGLYDPCVAPEMSDPLLPLRHTCDRESIISHQPTTTSSHTHVSHHALDIPGVARHSTKKDLPDRTKMKARGNRLGRLCLCAAGNVIKLMALGALVCRSVLDIYSRREPRSSCRSAGWKILEELSEAQMFITRAAECVFK